MRFRPTGGMSTPKAIQARNEASTENKTPIEEVFDINRHHKEIEQAENLAAGLPASSQA